MRPRRLLALVTAWAALGTLAAVAPACGSRSELYGELLVGLNGPDAAGSLDAGEDAADDASTDAPPPPAALSCKNAVFDVCGTNMYQPGAPWPTYQRCSSHAGRTSVVGPTNPVILWESASPGGNGLTGPPSISADGTIYVSGSGTLVAFDPGGSQKWVAKLTALDTGASTVAVGPDGTIFIALDRVYAVSSEGTTKWSSMPLSVPGATGVFGALGSSGSSVVLGPCGTLYIGAGLGLLLLDQSGNELWDHDGQGLTPAVQPDGTSFYGSGGEQLFAVAPTGSTDWTFVGGGEAGASGWIQPAPALADDGTLYYGATAGLYAVTKDGAQRWVRPWEGDAATGSLASVALGANGTVYVVSPDGTLEAIAADGTLDWSLPIHASGTPPIVDGDGVIFALGGSSLYAVRPSGSIEWTLTVASAGQGAMALGADGTLYLVTSDIYAIGNTH